MRLEEIKKLLDCQLDANDVEIKGLAYDSRKVEAGFIFFAIKGETYDGHDYVEMAIKKGAVAVVGEDDLSLSVAYLMVHNAKKALARVSHYFHDKPSNEIKVVGVTGTNGKTSVTHLIHYIYNHLGVKNGLIGTNSWDVGVKKKAVNTTPMSLDLNEMLRLGIENGREFVIMEVSSHGIKENRVDLIDFDSFIYTNLSEDHLDYHKNFDDYMFTKMRPFMWFSTYDTSKCAIINIDDEFGSYFVNVTNGRVLTYGLGIDADFQARNIVYGLDRTAFDLHLRGKFVCHVESPMFGKYNVYNVLAVFAYFYYDGWNCEKIALIIKGLPTVTGRFEKFTTKTGVNVIIDYAHTPDSIYQILTSLNVVARGDIITIVGAGGDRDKTKRPLMGKHALALSTHVYFTSDNPRSENPQNIIYDMIFGNIKTNYTIVIDRKDAIEKALKQANPGDLVVILGKGHEKTQTIGEVAYPFSDVDIAKQLVKENRL